LLKQCTNEFHEPLDRALVVSASHTWESQTAMLKQLFIIIIISISININAR